MKVKTTCVAIAIGMIGLNTEAAVEKIAIVDVQATINASNKATKTKAQMEIEYTEKMAGLNKEKTSIEEAVKSLQLQSNDLDPKVRQTRERDLSERMETWSKKFRTTDMEFRNREQKHLEEIVNDIRTIVQESAIKEKFDLVFDKNQSGLLYIKDGLSTDITQSVIAAFNKKFK